MSYAQHPEIHNEEQAIKWINDLVATVERKRQDCNVQVPGDPITTAAMQKKAYSSVLIHYGIARGALVALIHCRRISEIGFEKMKDRVETCLVPTVVGRV